MIMGSKQRVFVTRSECENETLDILRDQDIDVEVNQEPGKCPPELLKEKLKSGVAGILVFLGDSIDKEIIDTATKDLRVVSTFSVGYDHLDVDYIKSKGIIATYTPGAVSTSTAETALTLILMVLKRVQESQSIMRTYYGSEAYFPPTWVRGNNLNKKVIGVIGMGRIGREISKRIIPFGPDSILYTGKTGPKKDIDFARYCELDELLSSSDIVIISCSLNSETTHFIDMKAFDQMKKTGIIINVARGGIIQQDDLVQALQNKKISGAGIDVMTPEPLERTNPLLNMPNVVVFPHIGTNTVETRLDMGKMAADNIVNVLKNKEIVNQIP
uniref:Glyoxylate reductase/hydroxypyruvate reductase n=1 Tax=Lepeophtheirus salmonis TaxID=72036 RepID=C1BSN9_LEPSM|nr:Glyoxylate reductase/hydroxypyruvate reductase [Lepeophtheirus salmonis]